MSGDSATLNTGVTSGDEGAVMAENCLMSEFILLLHTNHISVTAREKQRSRQWVIQIDGKPASYIPVKLPGTERIVGLPNDPRYLNAPAVRNASSLNWLSSFVIVTVKAAF